MEYNSKSNFDKIKIIQKVLDIADIYGIIIVCSYAEKQIT